MKKVGVFVLVAQLAVAAALLGGCGQKGPLQLPDETSQRRAP